MKSRPKKPFIPMDRKETIRQGIITALKGDTLSAKELSGAVRISEKEVYDHLDHIQRSVQQSGSILAVTPAECRKCGFVFSKREKLKKPGRCPVCKGESIEQPLFAIREED